MSMQYTGPMDWARLQVSKADALRKKGWRRGGGRGLGGLPDYEVIPEAPPSPAPPVAGGVAQAAPTAAAAPTTGPLEQAQADYLREMSTMQGDAQEREDMVAEGALGLTGLEDERGVFNEQLGEAQRLRDTPMQDLRQAGRVVVAANPLEGIATAVQRIRGNKQEKEALEGIEGVNTRRKSSIDSIIGALRNRRKKPMDEEIPSGLPGASF